MKKVLNVLSGLNGASLIRGLRLGPREFVRACLESHAAAHPFEDKPHLDQRRIREQLDLIPATPLADVLEALLGENKRTLKINLARHEDGRLPVRDGMALLAILAAENPREVLEIGTYMGHTTRAMAETLPDGFIHTVDLPPDFFEPENSDPNMPKDDFHLIRSRVVGREFKGQEAAARIRQHFGDTAKINFQEFGKPTFFFIDGSHTYEYCKQDSEKCLALGGGKGVFLWHDCDEWHPGVVKFALEWRAAGRNLRRISGTSLAYWKA